MRVLFAVTLMLAVAFALPTSLPAAAKSTETPAAAKAAGETPTAAKAAAHAFASGNVAASAKKIQKAETGLLASAKRFFASFHKSKSSTHPYLAGPGNFMTEFKKMNNWWCTQEGHADQRMCMIQAGKKVTKGTPTAKGASITDIRKAYCAVETNKETSMCKMSFPMGLGAMGGISGAMHRHGAI